MTQPVRGIILALCLLTSLRSYGQVFTANVTGIATDPNEAAVPEAKITIKNVATNEERRATTGSSGRYTISQLLPGTYELSAEMTGFRRFVQKGIELVAGQSAELNIPMQLGEVTQTVEIQGSVLQVDTQTANREVTLDRQQVTDLPLNGGNRNPFNLIWTQAGVTAVRTGISTAPGDENQGRFAMNGGRDESVLLLLDGMPAQGGDWGSLLVSPGADSVQEVQIVANSYDSQYGKSGGGVVSMITKGGSNQFHGTLFEFFRNGHMDANSWANDRAGVKKPIYSKNQFGGNFSGPIWKSKRLFFFGGYDAARVGTPTSVTATVPTLLQREGDFSQTFNANGTLAVIYNPFTTRPNPNGSGFIRDPFPGNVIPKNLFDPVGAKVVNLYPLPNQPGDPFTLGRNRFDAGKTSNPADRYDVRVDWARSEKHTFYMRVTREKNTDFGAIYPTNPIASRSNVPNWRYQTTMGNTFVIRPTFIVNVLLAYGRWAKLTLPAGYGLYTGATVGLPASVTSQYQINSLPNFAPSNYFTLGAASYDWRSAESHGLQINATKEHGAHSFKFGFAAERLPLDVNTLSSGTFNFTRGVTAGPVAATDSTVTGNAIASLLLGVGSSGSVNTSVAPAMNATYLGVYFQDAWRVNQRLTVNYGLRWETQRPRTERYNQFSWFNFSIPNPIGKTVGLPLVGGLEFANKDNRGLWEADNFNWAPRFGFAYKLTDKMVLRGGYGIYYLLNYAEQQLSGLYGYSSTTTWNATQGGDLIHPQDLISNPFPTGFVQPTRDSQGLLTGLGQSLTPNAWQRKHPSGYTQNFSADLQYQVGKSGLFGIGYSGSLGRKLLYGYARNANQLPSSLLSLGSALDQQVPNPFFGIITSGPLAGATVPRQRLLRPYPQFDAVTLPQSTPGASSEYNSLTIKFQKRWGDQVNVITSYQYSKSLDNTSENQGWEVSDNIRDVNNLSREWSISAHDVPQSFVNTVIYNVPVGAGRKFASKMPAVAEAVLGGWEISGIVRLITGLPVQVTAPNTLSQYGFAISRPNIANVHDLELPHRSPDLWFNTAAFTAPAPYTIGNVPRWFSNLRQDMYKQADISIMKNFNFLEHFRAQFRVEAYNALNTPQFAAPNTVLGDPSFGKVSAAQPMRVLQLGLKIYF